MCSTAYVLDASHSDLLQSGTARSLEHSAHIVVRLDSEELASRLELTSGGVRADASYSPKILSRKLPNLPQVGSVQGEDRRFR